MKKPNCDFLLFVCVWAVCGSLLASNADELPQAPVHLRCEYLVDPLGIDINPPRLSWQLATSSAPVRGLRQTAYQVLVASTLSHLREDRGDLWDSGKVQSDQSVHVPYAGKSLSSRTSCFWKVRIWEGQGRPSDWSAPARWTMGLLAADDWKAEWIGLDEESESPRRLDDFKRATWIWFPEGNPREFAPAATRYFRRTIEVSDHSAIQVAECIVAADDVCTVYVNGTSVGSAAGHPNLQRFDVAKHLRPGKNVVAVEAANGRVPPGQSENPAGLIGVVSVTLRTREGKTETLTIPTDSQWRTSQSLVAGWQSAAFDDSKWSAAKALGAVGIGPWGNPWGEVIHSEHRRLAGRMLRRDFTAEKKLRRATAYVCGLGFFELYLNGAKVGDDFMSPALTEYTKQACYVTFDVTDRIKLGANALGVMLGNGRFFAPRVNVPVPMKNFGYPKLLLQLEIEYGDGSQARIVSDSSWKVATDGPILANSEYDGEEYDARREQAGWASPGFDDQRWRPALKVAPPGGRLAAQTLEPIRVLQRLKPIAITNPKPGIYLVDFGQSFYGVPNVNVRGPAGTRIEMHTSFTVDADGLLKAANDRSAQNTDVYILKGQGEESWRPRFKANATRYIQVTGFPGVPTAENFEGLVLHTDMEPVGEFECSHPLLNRIYQNARWGTRMQNRSIPMEPDRDERMGWAGHPAKTSESEAYNYNVARLYDHWLTCLALDQRDDGCLPDISPTYWSFYNGSLVWPSVITVIPDWYYRFYGDRRLLEKLYPCMKKWVLFCVRTNQRPDGTIERGDYGDWVDASSIGGNDRNSGATPQPLIATAYHYNNCRIMERAARLLNKPDDERHFAALADQVKTGFQQRFFQSAEAKYESGTQCSSVLPLAFGLAPDERRQAIVRNLVDDILVKHRGHTSVGLVGMQWFMQTLSNEGHPEVAYTVATQTTRPSWGYMVSKGATTSWERWDCDTQGPGMNGESQKILSGNLEAWMFQTLAGINYDPQRPGFKHIVLRPRPVGDLTWVKAQHRCLYGAIRSEWEKKDGRFSWSIAIPPNTTATVHVPASVAAVLTEGERPIAEAEGLKLLRREEDCAVFEAQPGVYKLRASMVK